MEDQVDRLDRTRIVLVAVLFCVHAMYSSHRRDGACHTTPATNSNKQPQPPTHHFFLMDSHTSCSSDWTTVSSAFSTPNPLRCHHTKYVFWGCVFFSLYPFDNPTPTREGSLDRAVPRSAQGRHFLFLIDSHVLLLFSQRLSSICFT